MDAYTVVMLVLIALHPVLMLTALILHIRNRRLLAKRERYPGPWA